MSRIIAGSAKGASLRTPSGERTRPTTDRVREAVFSSLATWFDTGDQAAEEQLAEASFLDLFAGSGAVGLEAASRGARRVVLVEKDRATCELIRRNAAATKVDAQVHNASVAGYLAGSPRPFDVVWLDPPYDLPNEDVESILTRLIDGWLVDDGLVVVERSARDPEPTWPAALCEHWDRRYGETTVYFARTGAVDD